ncbi:MAG: RDD family protein [Chloroflexota bacterium]
MYCPNCGTLNLNSAESCVNCKNPLPTPNQGINESPPPPQSGNLPEGMGNFPPRRDYYPGQPGSQYSFNPGGGYNQSGAYSSGPSYYAAPPPTGSPSTFYNPVYSYGIPTRISPQNAGFWVRLGAWLVDSTIVGLLTLLVAGIPQVVYWSSFVAKYGTEIARNCPSSYSYRNSTAMQQICNSTVTSIFLERDELNSLLSISLSFSFLALVLSLVYYVGLTAYGATLGKKVFGLKVVGPEGKSPGFGRALLRMTLGYWISSLIFYLGFIWIGLDEQKQGWHDKIAQTYVVRT